MNDWIIQAQNLRLLVLDSEKRKDELNDKVSKQTAKMESLQAEHVVIQRENSRLYLWAGII